MKRIIATSVIVFLTGCSNIRFDSMNYDRILTLHATAKSMSVQCDHPDLIRQQLPELQRMSNHVALYSRLRSGGPEVASSTAIVESMVNELVSKYVNSAPSTGYCSEKLKSISDATYTVASALGAQQ